MIESTLLKEKDPELQKLALVSMLNQVDVKWSQISDHLVLIEQLSENQNFFANELASLLCSKIYFHLDNQDDALNYALRAGKLFNHETNDQFTKTLTGHCIEQYINRGPNFPKEKEQLVEEMLNSSCQKGNFVSAIGLALDCQRIDIVKIILDQWDSPHKMLQVLNLVGTVQNPRIREQAHKLAIEAIEKQPNEPTNEEQGLLVNVLVQLGEVQKVAEVLWRLLKSNVRKGILLAYQLAFDLQDNQTPGFIDKLIESLPIDTQDTQREKLINILQGKITRKLYADFLVKFNNFDQVILNNIKGYSDPKFSVYHGGALMGISISLCGTQNQSFLADHNQWATKCAYWQRFTGVSSLGLINKYNLEGANQLFAQSLNKPDFFEQGGAYYGLGLVKFASKDRELINKLNDALISVDPKEQVIHGVCLGLGLVQFGSSDSITSLKFKDLIAKNESVIGEGAGIGLGLLHAGSGNIELSQELIKLAQQSDKEKITRTLALAVACTCFNQEDKTDNLIETMLKDQEPFIRYGGCFAYGLAYAGTANNKIIQRLLQMSVDDVSDDVRRAAVISFGFLLSKNYEQAPKVMKLLKLSYNPHIRYGTAIALGISCAGTSYVDAIQMLEPMLTDNVDYVRQGALIAIGLIMSQVLEKSEPKMVSINKAIKDIAAKKHETVLVKLGSCLAQGLLEAGGRNMVVQLTSRSGFPKVDSCIGMLWFVNYWFWYPCLSMIGLALQPIAYIGLNDNLEVNRDLQLSCDGFKDQFDYPPKLSQDEKKATEKKTALLSVTNKVKARTLRKEAQNDSQSISEHISRQVSELKQQGSKIIDEPIKQTQPVIEEQQQQKGYILENPTRILERQKKLIQIVSKNRFQPIIQDRKQGIVIIFDEFEPARAQSQNQSLIQSTYVSEIPEQFVFDEAQQ